MLLFADENMPLQQMFPQDNHFKHISKLSKSWFDTNKNTLMQWSAQSPNINPTENLWKPHNDKLKNNRFEW